MTAPPPSRLPLLLASLLVAAPLAPAQDRFPLSDEHQKWLEEEVIYIISEREKDAFQRLHSEAEREAFIAAFWARRDPEPLTPENEFRTEHYARIAYANSRLGGETPQPGWMTDRGRVYIKLGEPDDRETFQAVPGLYPAELWFYLQQKEVLLPPLYILFFRDNNSGPYRQFNHVFDDPEDLLPAQALDINDSRRAAFEFLQEMSPQLAHSTITMRADRGPATGLMQPDQASLDAAALLLDIERAPHRRLDTNWVSSADAGRGLVETEYLFNFVPSAGITRVLAGPQSPSTGVLVHYAVEIEPQHFTLARQEDGDEYFTRFEIQGEVTNDEGTVIYGFAATPFLRLTESQLQEVGARPFAYRGMFPLIPGHWQFRIVLKNEARTEYTVFEDELRIPDPSTTWLGRPFILHAHDPATDLGATWTTASFRLTPNARASSTVGSHVQVAVAANGTDTVSLRAYPWEPGDIEGGGRPPPTFETEIPVTTRLGVAEIDLGDWDTGRYLLVAAQGDQRRNSVFDLSARRGVSTPWGLTDSFDPLTPGAAPASLAEQWLRLDQMDRARPLFEVALRANPNLVRARTILARIALDEERSEDAVRLLEPALAQQPNSPQILRPLADAHLQARNLSRAVELFERAIALEAPDTSLLNALGVALVGLGDNARAISYLERSLALDNSQDEVRELVTKLRAGL